MNDIANLLDLACIKYTGLPLPDEFTSKNDWSYTIVDGKKVAKYTIPNSILMNPYQFSYPNPFPLQIKRQLITDELKSIWEVEELKAINIEDFYYGYYVLKQNGGTWRQSRNANACPVPTKLMETNLRPLVDAIDDEITLYDKRASNRRYRARYNRGNNTSPKRIISRVLGNKNEDLNASEYHTLFNILEIVIGESNDKTLQEYFTNWDKKTQQEKFGGNFEKIAKGVKRRSNTTNQYQPSPYFRWEGRKEKLYSGISSDNCRGWIGVGDKSIATPNRYSMKIKDITLKQSDIPVNKKSEWTNWYWMVMSAYKTDENSILWAGRDSIGHSIKDYTEKRKGFWGVVKSQSHRLTKGDSVDWRKSNQPYYQQKLVKSLLKMGGIPV
jgi:hypothetical protein